MKLVVLLSVLLLAVIVNWVLRNGGDSFNPVAAAAVRTQAAPGARYSIVAVYTSAALPRAIVARGSGAYNSRTGRARATLRVPSAGGSVKVESVGDERTIYLRAKAISAGLPPGRHWLGVQPWLGRSSAAALAGNGSAASQLEMMQAVASDVEEIGEEPVRGIPTHRYRASIELSHYAQLLRQEGKVGSARQYEQLAKLMPAPIEVEAWIDDAGLVRRVREVLTLPSQAGHSPVTMDLRMDLFALGASPDVRLPPAREVFDSTPIERAQLNLLNGESARRLIAPSGAPLSEPAFHRAAGEICTGLERRLGGLRRRAAPERLAWERLARERGTGSRSSQQTLRTLRAVSYSYFEPALVAVENGLSRLGRLSPPADRVTPFRRFMRQSAAYLEIDLAETRAAELGQFKLARLLQDRLSSLSGPIEWSTRAAGLPGICAAHDESESGSPASPSQPS